MRLSGSLARERHVGALIGVIAVGLLAGCASTSGGGSGSASPGPLAGLFGGGANKNVTAVPTDNAITPQMFLDAGYCPPVQIRPGTEALIIYDKGHDDDPNFIRYQGSIGQTARECHTLGGTTLTIKVGIAGRLVAGPKGAAGNFLLPLRVAVIKQHGGNVLYSQVQKVPATLSAPDYGADFSTVVDNISLTITPDDHDLIIYVGYDEGKPKAPPPQPPQPSLTGF